MKLVSPARVHEPAFLAAVERSVSLHGEWVTPPTTPEQYRRYLKRVGEDRYFAYFVLTPEGELAGVINVSEIVRADFQSAYLGYYAFTPHAGCGHMTAGLREAVTRAFGEHGLHRLEANIQPGNAPSIALVERLGFAKEGFSPKYLKIAGEWRDHERWAVTAEMWGKEC